MVAAWAMLDLMSPPRKPTDFESLVYNEVRGVPSGFVTTYGAISRRLGRGTARSVGTALSKNPFAPEVPCHRVVRADGHLGGFNGATEGPEMLRKLELLAAESVGFLPDGRVAPASILRL
jgi:methylated-DNA-[protein]-cysteine S-methyltransferase